MHLSSQELPLGLSPPQLWRFFPPSCEEKHPLHHPFPDHTTCRCGSDINLGAAAACSSLCSPCLCLGFALQSSFSFTLLSVVCLLFSLCWRSLENKMLLLALANRSASVQSVLHSPSMFVVFCSSVRLETCQWPGPNTRTTACKKKVIKLLEWSVNPHW